MEEKKTLVSMSMLVFWVSCSWSEFCSNVNKPSDRTQPAVSQLWCLWLPSRRSTASRWQALVTVTRSSADLRPPREDYLMTEDLQRSAKQRLDCWLIFNLFPQFHKKKKKNATKKNQKAKTTPGPSNFLWLLRAISHKRKPATQQQGLWGCKPK